MLFVIFYNINLTSYKQTTLIKYSINPQHQCIWDTTPSLQVVASPALYNYCQTHKKSIQLLLYFSFSTTINIEHISPYFLDTFISSSVHRLFVYSDNFIIRLFVGFFDSLEEVFQTVSIINFCHIVTVNIFFNAFYFSYNRYKTVKVYF